ncbi:cysteine-rich receptor-like protein kinase 10 [Carex littledalei]|uniref:Cysteine-rich receptor-like protein kinase 10 n=1 Tax=Carex littledalei TaxID=544730 RepID=A0A833VBZ4_9POAL|nr:cysteine-rich receptor-like protein kinase 10 [Carex littledalei]
MDRIGLLIATFMLFFITVDGKGSNNGNTIIMPLTIAAGNNLSNGREDVQIFEFFDFKRIIAATDDFSDMKIIGKGQLGPVYKGVLENGEEIAVKRVSRSAHNGNEQLKNELNLLARLKHKNLVKLMGFCIQQQEIILCFEFMPNHSLDLLLFGIILEEEVELNWEQRSRLIQGISSGLLYLHEDYGHTIIHRDVKPANILLDKDMVPKISDFGISRLFEEDRSFFTTSTIGGTRGYMSPELQSGMLSTKADVYSFGMVVLEIISGIRNTSCPSGLVSLVLEYLNEGRILDLKDARLREPCSDGEIKRSIHIALLCLLEEPHRRPDMRQINHWLTCQSTHPPTLPVQASHWGNIVIDRSTVVDSSTLLQT